jgi:hypothetical protein
LRPGGNCDATTTISAKKPSLVAGTTIAAHGDRLGASIIVFLSSLNSQRPFAFAGDFSFVIMAIP